MWASGYRTLQHQAPVMSLACLLRSLHSSNYFSGLKRAAPGLGSPGSKCPQGSWWPLNMCSDIYLQGSLVNECHVKQAWGPPDKVHGEKFHSIARLEYLRRQHRGSELYTHVWMKPSLMKHYLMAVTSLMKHYLMAVTSGSPHPLSEPTSWLVKWGRPHLRLMTPC